MAQWQHKMICNEDLDEWKLIGKGGFGNVYKVKHKNMGHELAIKLLHPDVRIFGMYDGIPPFGHVNQKGMALEFMKRGSIETLCKKLSGPPPFSLACRLIDQVAKGMNFLHSKNITHRDLKPQNVMLSDDLQVRLADFGLCTVSATQMSRGSKEKPNIAGTLQYMPPEAFKPDYKVSYSFDSYSYGILMWSILSGREPYTVAEECDVKASVIRGQRPCLERLAQKTEDGNNDLLDLMPKCWDGVPKKRPTFKECLQVTERVSAMHERAFSKVVFEAVCILDDMSVTGPYTPRWKRLSDEDKEIFVDSNREDLINFTSKVMEIVDELRKMVHREAYYEIEGQKSSYMKMVELWDGPLHSGGQLAKAAFYDALEKHEPLVLRYLTEKSLCR